MSEMSELFHLLVISPEARIFEGDVKSLTSINDKGKFDVLPMHANFVSLIRDFLIINDSTGKVTKMNIEKGVLKVISNQAEVFLGIEETSK